MKVLLDTCTFLWIVGGGRALPARAAAAYRAAENEVYLSAVSAWEIAVKHAMGRLPLPQPPAQLVPAERDARGIATLEFDEESALHVARLPELHRDPFDRMLVSQALVHGLVILTPDPIVGQYPARTMWG
jgi:PIN domain nuclease of toxin-antitoxin system